MAHGTTSVQIIRDENGRAIELTDENGRLELPTTDRLMLLMLTSILDELAAIREILAS